MITTVILWDGNEEKLNQSLAHLARVEAEFRNGMQIAVLLEQESGETMPPDRTERCAEVLHTVGRTCGLEPERFLTETDPVQSAYFCVIRAGEYYREGALERLCRALSEHPDTDAAVPVNAGSPEKHAGGLSGEKTVWLDKADCVLRLPFYTEGTVIRMSAAGSAVPVKELLCFRDFTGLAELLEQKKTVLYAADAVFCGDILLPLAGARNEWRSRNWYFGRLAAWKAAIGRYPDRNLPVFLQAQILTEMQNCFVANHGNRNQGVLLGKDLERFLEGCTECLQAVGDELITASDRVHEERRLLPYAWSVLMSQKYRMQNAEVLMSVHWPVTLDLMEYDRGRFWIDASVERFVTEKLTLKVRRNGRDCAVRKNSCFFDGYFFGVRLVEKDSFSIEIPYGELDGRGGERLTFSLVHGDRELRLPIVTVDYESRLTRKLKNSYWCFRDYMVTFEFGGNCVEKAAQGTSGEQADLKKYTDDVRIRVRKAARITRMMREGKLLYEILRAPYGSKRMFVIRLLYWLSYPLYARKQIWLTFDKLYKGGDCGEYFYRYMMTRKKDGITPGYIIRSDAKDLKRLRAEGYEPLIYGSRKQRLMYLHASMIFATHSSVHGFCGFSKWEIRFVQDRLRAVNTCIQHGLSVQDLRADSNRLVNNNKRYYCASVCEVENLSKPEYDYDKEVLRLTGLARYDGLVNRDRKQILITPTWRAYISMPSVMGSTRPYNPDFKNTDYFRIFQELLENKKLLETASRTGYEIVYLLHPVISAQKEDFRAGEGVRLLQATEISYEQVLTESSLMVTDYSGVQFDFAYMRKPLVYFHPPKLPPHYEEGGFSYETQGFGEICTKTQELVDVLCGYMETGCMLKPEYRRRQDDFFAFDDHENCRRIFEDALEYGKSVKRS